MQTTDPTTTNTQEIKATPEVENNILQAFATTVTPSEQELINEEEITGTSDALTTTEDNLQDIPVELSMPPLESVLHNTNTSLANSKLLAQTPVDVLNASEEVAAESANNTGAVLPTIPAIYPELQTTNEVGLASRLSIKQAMSRPFRVRIGMVFGPDADYVMSPYDRQFEEKPFNQFALGYSGGITLGFQYNRWELETGAMYSAKSYEPRNAYEINGSFAQGGYTRNGLVSSEMDILRIP